MYANRHAKVSDNVREWLYKAQIFFMGIILLLFLKPVLTGAHGLRRRKVRGTDRLLTCCRLPLLMRGTASLLAATTLSFGSLWVVVHLIAPLISP